MGNKQSDKLFNNQQPRNIFSLYGPKTTSSQIPSTSMLSSTSDSSTCQLDNQKKLLRLSRAHRTKRLDGFKVHNTPTSLMPAFKFITKYLDAKTTAEFIIKFCLVNQINARLFDVEFLKCGIKEVMYGQQDVSNYDLQQNQDQKQSNSISNIYDQEQQLGTQVIQIKQMHKRPKGDSLKGQEIQEIDNHENIGRPTAIFGDNVRNSELSQDNVDDLPQLGKKDTFGELGGIQITNQQSFEDPDFAAAPCRQTAYFGEIERQSQLKGFYKQLAQKQQDNYYQNMDFLQNQEVKEEDNDDESGDENDHTYNKNNYQVQNQQYQQNKKIDYSYQDDNYSEEDSEEPAIIAIDLSAMKKKQQQEQIQPIVVNISKDTSKQTSSSKSPKSQTQIKQVWKPTSPNLSSTTEKSPIRTLHHKQSNSATKLPIKIDLEKKEKKKSGSFLIINKTDKNRVKNKSQDFTKDLKDIDTQIDKITNDIEVLDQIKQDISKVQNKIIRDMSPSYRQQPQKK